MGESLGNKELKVVLFAQLNGKMLSESGGAASDIDRNVKNSSPCAPYQFGLGERRLLEMKAPDYTVRREALIILDKVHRTYQFLEIALGETLEEIAACIFKNARF